MREADLHVTARELVAPHKGILAADESSSTIEKRFKSIDLESTEENRRAYRDMLLTAPLLERSISGVIMFDETIRQKSADGRPFCEVLAGRGIIPGIKVDTGAKDLALFAGEKVTEGLDGLRDRCEEYAGLGARFTKWRAVIAIGSGIPTDFCILANAHALARFAALSQEAGLVPIVEPEVLMDGGHSIDRCYETTARMLAVLFEQLGMHDVDIQGTLLKTNMVLSGEGAHERAGVEEVADQTVKVLEQSIPPDLPGVVFLSGGQSDEEATAHLNAMNQIDHGPWELSFSYGRALQSSSLGTWKGKASNLEAAQKALSHRARLNRAARSGSYTSSMESEEA